MKKIIAAILILIMSLSTISFSESDTPSTWAEEPIKELKSLDKFREEAFTNYKDDITRLDFIYLSVRLYEVLVGEEVVIDKKISFTDTNDTYALKGATLGITTGVGNNKFGADELLNREQLATFMIRVLNMIEVEMKSPSTEKFADDIDISDWAKDAIYKAKNNNIIGGVGANKVDPKGNASVEVALVITNRILKENNGKNALKKDGSKFEINIEKPIKESMEITATSPVEGEVSDITNGKSYESDEMSQRNSFMELSSWSNNDYKRKENSSQEEDFEALDEMLATAGLDISNSGRLQAQTSNENAEDHYSKAWVGRTDNQPTIFIRDWATNEGQRTSVMYVASMNMVRETIKYYSESNADAELIYEYIDNAVTNKQNIAGPEKVFGSTTIKFEDPGSWGIDVIFVE